LRQPETHIGGDGALAGHAFADAPLRYADSFG
jgi:hypothetical protein